MPDSAIYLPVAYDFRSTAQVQNATALDTAIMAKTPWAYWKLNEASGAPQDSSGNARHGAVGLGGMQYQQAAITSKAGLSVRFEGNRFTFPIVQTNLDSLSGLFTYIGLFYFEAEVGTGSPGQIIAYGSPFFFQTGGNTVGTSPMQLGIATYYASGLNNGSGAILTIRDGNYAAGGGQRGLKLNAPTVIALVGSSIPGTVYTWDLYINGCLAGSNERKNQAGGGTMGIGRHSDPVPPFARFKASNIACFATELSPTDIRDLTQCYMDKTAYATVWQV